MSKSYKIICLAIAAAGIVFSSQAAAMSRSWVDEMNEDNFNSADLDGSGTLDFLEFSEYYGGNVYAAAGAFGGADVNQDSLLNLGEFVDAITTES